MAETIRENKAQRAERLKRDKNPWECLQEIRGFSTQGYSSIPGEWLGTYLRWWGVYTQGDGAGVVGGKGGEGKAVPFFLVRIRIPNGQIFSHQLRELARISELYARGSADITVRQNLQLHWVTIEDLPNVLEALWRVGLNSMGACGDVTRNITGCPVAGVDADEICDASSLAQAASRLFAGNADYYNLPRKFKISISGCSVWCEYPEINDIGVTAVRRARASGSEVGFSIRVGGGLSTDPHLALPLPAFVGPQQVLSALQGIAQIFRDSGSLRENRERARLKFLFLRQGWTAEGFLRELEERVGFRFDPAVEERSPDDVYRDHVGVHPQKQPGYRYVGTAVARGRISVEQMRKAAELAERLAGGELRTTNMQNLLVVNVPEENAGKLAEELGAIGLPCEASVFRRGAIACSGTEFCKLAITETKAFTRWLFEDLEERLPGFEQQLKLHVTGCPNSCGQHWIADIGLEGKKIKLEGGMQDAFYFCLGGALGRHQAIARPVGYRCLAREVPAAIERLLICFQQERLPGENLRQFFARHSTDELRQRLAGSTPGALEGVTTGEPLGEAS